MDTPNTYTHCTHIHTLHTHTTSHTYTQTILYMHTYHTYKHFITITTTTITTITTTTSQSYGLHWFNGDVATLSSMSITGDLHGVPVPRPSFGACIRHQENISLREPQQLRTVATCSKVGPTSAQERGR